MKLKSIWNEYSDVTQYPNLSQDAAVDVAIIGGGITGITTAQLLSQAGLKVAVLEERKIGGGTTSHSTGNLYIYDKYITQIHQKFGTEVARDVVATRSRALEQIKGNVHTHKIDCDFQLVGWHVYSATLEANKKVESLLETAKSISLTLSKVSLQETPYQVNQAIKLEGQAQFNPMRYVQGLAKAISTQCKIYENTQVTDVSEVNGLMVCCTPHGKISSKYVVHATHTPKGIMTVQTMLGPYREYGIACKIKEQHPRGIFWGYYEENELISTRTYVRNGESYLVVVGHPHKVGQVESNANEIKKLEDFAHKHFTVLEITHKWGGQHYRPADFLPYIGRKGHKSNIFIATGFSTDGLTYGTVAAQLITDDILANDNPALKIFDPARYTPIKSAPQFIKENLNVMKQYLLDLPKRADGSSFKEVATGDGKIIEMDGQKLAVHRSADDKLHVCSAVCTHMQCIVNWNDAEKSWDCPCHGSRYDFEGKVLEGPTTQGLDLIVIEGEHVRLREQI